MSQINQAKARQLEAARLRAKQAPRRSSSQAISSETQSEVTEHAPNLYRVPKINIPDNLHDVAKLIQSELQKIESSQSVLLSLWRKVMDGAPTDLVHVGDYGIGSDAQVLPGVASQFFSSSSAAGYVPGIGGGFQSCYNTIRRAQVYVRSDGKLFSRFSESDQALDEETPWIESASVASLSEFAQQVKAEMFAELLALNPGIVIPQTD